MRLKPLTMALAVLAAQSVLAAEPLTRSCSTGFEANDLLVTFADSAKAAAAVAMAGNPAANADFFVRLQRPTSARLLLDNFVSFTYDFSPLVDTAEVASGITGDPVLAALGVRQASPDLYGCFPEPPPPGRVDVTEYHNVLLDHYFLSSSAGENAAIDSGAAGPGWVRTGEAFATYPSNACSGGLPVFRFYGAGPNSHFFTVDAGECGAVHNSDPGWQFEGIAFGAFMPVNGACTASQRPVYRLYNNRFAENDSNHRYVVRIDLYNAMIAQGWAGEGVAMCLPQAAQ